MASTEFEQALKDVEKSKEEIKKVLTQLRSDVNSLFSDLNDRKKSLLENNEINLLDHPTVTLTECFALGFYAGRMIKKLIVEKEDKC